MTGRLAGSCWHGWPLSWSVCGSSGCSTRWRFLGESTIGSYGDPRSVRRALEGIASRLRRPTPLATGIRELEERREDLEEHFLGLFPDVQAFVVDYRSG